MQNLHIVHTEWSNGWGGQEIRILEDITGLKERGHRVELIGVPEGKLAKRAGEMGITFHPMSMKGPWDVKALAGLKGFLKERGVDIINTHSSVDSWLGGFAARMTRTACVRTRHLSVRVSRNPLNIVYRLPHVVTTTGTGIRRHLVEDYGLKADRVHSIPTGVDTGRFRPGPKDEALMAEFGIKPGGQVVAMVAILRSWKRHDIFCRMARTILDQRPDVHFLIVGDGPQREKVTSYLDEMNLRPQVVMTGQREDVERILPLCDVCVLASDQAEGVPQAVLQQFACERAVAASNAGDVSDVVRHEKTGLLVEPGSHDALAAAVTRLLDDEPLRKQLGRAGRKMVLASHSKDHMLNQTLAAYEQAMTLAGSKGAAKGAAK